MIVEGILVLTNPGLRELFDLCIYVDTDADLRVLRRLRRENATLQLENDILKKAAVILGTKPQPKRAR